MVRRGAPDVDDITDVVAVRRVLAGPAVGRVTVTVKLGTVGVGERRPSDTSPIISASRHLPISAFLNVTGTSKDISLKTKEKQIFYSILSILCYSIPIV